jgi:flagellar biosynthesis protein FliP
MFEKPLVASSPYHRSPEGAIVRTAAPSQHMIGKTSLSQEPTPLAIDCRFAAVRCVCVAIVILIACLGLCHSAAAQEAANQPLSIKLPDSLTAGPETWTSPEGLSSTLQVMLLLTVLSLAPAVLLMTTCFVRVIVVLGLLRQAIGTQQLPPSQVLTAMSLFVTLLVMMPVWKQVYDDAIVPYTHKEKNLEQSWTAGVAPVRRFMSMQIEHTGNAADVRMLLNYVPHREDVATYDDVPLQVLLPAFMLSELKTAFLIGFQIYLPFVILDLVIATVTVSMGMMMVPPTLVSLPFKLLLFVLVDGWRLVVGMLLESYQAFT